ncbi:cell division protein FtsX [Rubrimonas sp.]|uniref:cell division protein FtsX n=1 Tax=Rubrimonas sp. TaxID=2036015 RepID=UPI002FDDE519
MSAGPALPLAPRSAAPDLVALVAAAMCFLAVLALGAADGAARVAGAWRGGLEGAATVVVPAGADAAQTGARADAAIAALLEAGGLAEARALPPDEVAALMRPWIGAEPVGGALPALLALTPAPDFDPVAAQAALDAAAPGAALDDHALWRARVEGAATAFRNLALGSIALMGGALAAMVAAAARASLAGAASTVRTLRLLGAQDGFVARVFERPIAWRALAGGAVGAAAAALAAAALPDFDVAEALGAASEPGAPSGMALRAVALAPLAAAATAWATARLSILSLLRRIER